MSSKFEILSDCMYELDLDGLFSECGCPRDEYDGEVLKLVDLITEESTVEDIASYISDLFDSMYDEETTTNKIWEISTKIRKALYKD